MNNDTTSNTTDLRRQLRELTEQSLSPIGRYAHVLLLLAAACVGIVVAALLLTEPALPLRTQLAFGAMVAIAGSWVCYASWVLLRRRPLLQAHRVAAGYLACGFSGLFAGAALVTAIVTGSPAAWFAAGQGVLMLVIALMLLVRAHRQRDELQARRDRLVKALAA